MLLWTSGGGGGGGGGCGYGCGCDCDGRVVVVGAMNVFFCSEIYYFIVVVILFYCDVYIILLC